MLRPRPGPVRPGPARPGTSGDRRFSNPRTVPPRRREPAHHLSDRHARRARHAPAAGGTALLLARRTGPDGPAGQPAAARTLQRLGPAAIRLQQPRPRLGLPAELTDQHAAPARPRPITTAKPACLPSASATYGDELGRGMVSPLLRLGQAAAESSDTPTTTTPTPRTIRSALARCPQRLRPAPVKLCSAWSALSSTKGMSDLLHPHRTRHEPAAAVPASASRPENGSVAQQWRRWLPGP